MNRFHLIFLIFVLFAFLSGCSLSDSSAPDSSASDSSVSGSRFAIIDDYYDGFKHSLRIYVDRNTRVMYLYVKNGYSGGLSVMLDSDGKPLLFDGIIQE